ncbi:proline iminopeptidase-family hydrolase [uncultured Sphingomonas sp.]|uniref:proline iminopeptidase-family hydrolase n=1 Tax=uncultured Sphingomonas sp. TaxID=158754 RepID=UPI0025D2A48E|nr:proline iminopeptidase-family hydrolase [uncultured Sphingomonas sp.]
MPRLSRRALLAAGATGWLPFRAFARDATYPPPTREAMLPVPGGRVYVRVNGDLNAARAPLVMIHGGPGGTHVSMLDALALADERAVILYDQLDSGRSEWPQDPANWRVARFVDELEAVRRGLGVERWHVCGISWGGTIALEYAARRPAALASVVLGGPLIATKAWLADADALRATLPQAARDTLVACEGRAPPPATACDAATDVFYRHFNRREEAPPAMRAAARAEGNRGFNQRLYETMWGRSEFVSTGTLRDYDGTPLLAKLDGRRTLFMVGQYDEARPVTALDFARRVPGGAEVAVIPGAAHGTLSDRPIETVGVLRGWLHRHDTPGL